MVRRLHRGRSASDVAAGHEFDRTVNLSLTLSVRRCPLAAITQHPVHITRPVDAPWHVTTNGRPNSLVMCRSPDRPMFAERTTTMTHGVVTVACGFGQLVAQRPAYLSPLVRSRRRLAASGKAARVTSKVTLSPSRTTIIFLAEPIGCCSTAA